MEQDFRKIEIAAEEIGVYIEKLSSAINVLADYIEEKGGLDKKMKNIISQIISLSIIDMTLSSNDILKITSKHTGNKFELTGFRECGCK